MSKTVLEVAHETGVKKALAQCGYRSIEDVEKEAAALGLFEASEKTAAASALDFLKKKLG
jgi:hypothetical protein